VRIVRNTTCRKKEEFINVIVGGTYSYHWVLKVNNFLVNLKKIQIGQKFVEQNQIYYVWNISVICISLNCKLIYPQVYFYHWWSAVEFQINRLSQIDANLRKMRSIFIQERESNLYLYSFYFWFLTGEDRKEWRYCEIPTVIYNSNNPTESQNILFKLLKQKFIIRNHMQFRLLLNFSALLKVQVLFVTLNVS